MVHYIHQLVAYFYLLKNGCLMWQETRLMRAELQKQNNELKKWISEALKTDVSVPVENEVSEGMSDVRVWRLGYLKKQPGRLLETDGCEGSEVKFRKYTITALFWVTRHGHSGILCLCLQGISVASALVCIWESKGDCVVRGEGVGTWPQLHGLWFVDAEFKFSSPDLQILSVTQPLRQLKHFLQLISPNFFII